MTVYYLGMVVRISRPLLDAICAHAAQADPFECCGLLLGPRGSCNALDRAGVLDVAEILPAPNIAANPLSRFEVDPAILIAAHRRAREGGLSLIGHYHSHPRGEAIPSTVDAAMAQMDGEIWLLVGHDGAARAWRAVRGGPLHKSFEPVQLTVLPHGRVAPEGGDRHEGAALA